MIIRVSPREGVEEEESYILTVGELTVFSEVTSLKGTKEEKGGRERLILRKDNDFYCSCRRSTTVVEVGRWNSVRR